MISLELQATPDEVVRAVEQLRGFGRERGIDEKALFGVALALEECGANIVHYACRGQAQEKFRVSFECAAGVLSVELRDCGPAFDPTSAAARDLDDPDGNRPVGGWGIHLVRHYIDEAHYAREGGENVLRLIKRLQSVTT
jgi:anti-sigma regulatory factor (Ser/Thr protein kinase)